MPRIAVKHVKATLEYRERAGIPEWRIVCRCGWATPWHYSPLRNKADFNAHKAWPKDAAS